MAGRGGDTRRIRSHFGLCASCHRSIGKLFRDRPAPRANMRAMSERISRRIGAITESATLAVDAKAKAMQAAGEPVIGFGAGEPDFATPAHIVEAAVEACRNPKAHRYSPASGLPELREAIAHKTLRDSGYVTSAANVLVTNGGKQA